MVIGIVGQPLTTDMPRWHRSASYAELLQSGLSMDTSLGQGNEWPARPVPDTTAKAVLYSSGFYMTLTSLTTAGVTDSWVILSLPKK